MNNDYLLYTILFYFSAKVAILLNTSSITTPIKTATKTNAIICEISKYTLEVLSIYPKDLAVCASTSAATISLKFKDIPLPIAL